MPRLNLKFLICSELLVSDMGVNLSMCRLNLKFKIFSELLVSDIGGGQSSFYVEAVIMSKLYAVL